MKTRLHRGFATGSVLLLALVVVLLSAALGALAYFQLIEAETAVRSQDAVLLAESAVNQVIAQFSTPPYGTYGILGATWTFKPNPADPTRFATVIFDPTGTQPYSSLNNLIPRPNAAMGWNGVPIPPFYARIIGNGTSHGLVRHVETVIRAYEYPYALAWAGALCANNVSARGAGTLRTFVLDKGIPCPAFPVTVAYLGKTPLTLSNLTVRGNMVYLDTADGGGGVTLPPCPPSCLQTLRGVSNLQLPTIDVSGDRSSILSVAWDGIIGIGTPNTLSSCLPCPIAPLSCGSVNTRGYFTTPSLTVAGGLNMHNVVLYVGNMPACPPCCPACLVPAAGLQVGGGNLTANDSVIFVSGPLQVQGDLVLNHSLVYVMGGDVTVQGAIVGSGAVVGASNVRFHAMPKATMGSEVAVVGQRSVTLGDSRCGATPSFFQGLIYSGAAPGCGGLTLQGVASNPSPDLRLAGIFLAQGCVTATNAMISYFDQAAALRFATWQPCAAPTFGSVKVLACCPPPALGPKSFVSYDARCKSQVTCSAFTPCQICSIHGVVQSLATADPAYQAQSPCCIETLYKATFGSVTMHIEAPFYDPSLARFVVPQRGATFFNACGPCGPGVAQSQFDAVVTGTTAVDLQNALRTSQGLAADAANLNLAAMETAALACHFGGLPHAQAAERINLNLSLWLRISAMPSYTIVSWRAF